ncbi:hypothetical protein ACMBCN_02620 [Candidatus Liberibacter asiaticus]|nr:hypothetical protein [Candidatus Liberibacter asiaticus]
MGNETSSKLVVISKSRIFVVIRSSFFSSLFRVFVRLYLSMNINLNMFG